MINENLSVKTTIKWNSKKPLKEWSQTIWLTVSELMIDCEYLSSVCVNVSRLTNLRKYDKQRKSRKHQQWIETSLAKVNEQMDGDAQRRFIVLLLLFLIHILRLLQSKNLRQHPEISKLLVHNGPKGLCTFFNYFKCF